MDSARRTVELWRDRLATMARNIADLGDTDDVRRLRARLASGEPYEGTTLAAARRAAAALDALWSDYLLLSGTVDEAAELSRRTLLRPGRDDEALALLDRASIRLPAVSVPVRARGLLDAAERQETVTPREVLDAMVAGFDAARRGISAIAAAETAGRIKLAALRVGAGARDPAVAARLDAAERILARDPLESADALAAASATVAAGHAAAEAACRQRADLAEALAGRRRALDDLRRTLAARDAARAAAEPLIDLPSRDGSATTPEDLDGWLDRLARAGAAGQGDAARFGLQRWTEACATAQTAAAAESDVVARRLAERDDLRGRYRALRVKAEALAGRVAPSPTEVAAEMERRPFDAARARPALARFEAALAVLSRTEAP